VAEDVVLSKDWPKAVYSCSSLASAMSGWEPPRFGRPGRRNRAPDSLWLRPHLVVDQVLTEVGAICTTQAEAKRIGSGLKAVADAYVTLCGHVRLTQALMT